MLGVGGILAEAVADVVFRPAPLDLVTADEMIDELRTATLLGAFRGEAAVDRAALAERARRPRSPARSTATTSPASTSTR